MVRRRRGPNWISAGYFGSPAISCAAVLFKGHVAADLVKDIIMLRT